MVHLGAGATMSISPAGSFHCRISNKNPGDAAASNQAVEIGFLAYPAGE